jgi:hypothetical protein
MRSGGAADSAVSLTKARDMAILLFVGHRPQAMTLDSLSSQPFWLLAGNDNRR